MTTANGSNEIPDDALALFERYRRFVELQDVEDGRELCHPDILVVAYLEGEGGPETHIAGFDAVSNWVSYPDLGRFTFRALSVGLGEADARLPDADITLYGNMKIRLTEGPWAGWTNTNRWTVALRDGRVVGMVSLPTALTDDHWIPQDDDEDGS